MGSDSHFGGGGALAVTINDRSVDALTCVLDLEGELDLYVAADLNAALDEAIDEQCRRLVLDLRRVTRIDFSLIAIIVQTGRRLGHRHATLEVRCNEDEIGRLMAAAGERGNFAVSLDGAGA